MAPTIRPFEAADANGLVALVLGIQRDEFAIPVSLQDQPDLHNVSGYFRVGRGGFWIAASGAAIVGCAGLVDLGDGQGALRKMFVHAAYRGGRFEVARRLLAALLSHARAAGIDRIYLGTTEKFRAAHRFYEKNGFTLVSAAELPPDFSRMALDTRFYEIDLGAGLSERPAPNRLRSSAEGSEKSAGRSAPPQTG